jgi:hypothetical protein
VGQIIKLVDHASTSLIIENDKKIVVFAKPDYTTISTANQEKVLFH